MPDPATPGGSSTARTILRGATLILVITLIARIAGFVRYLVFGASVGAGDVGTAYTSANQVPNLLFEVVAGGALAATVVPLIAGLVSSENPERDPERAHRIVSVLLCWVLAVTVPLAIAVAVGAGPLSQLLLAGGEGPADDGTVQLGERMLRIFSVQLPAYGVTVVLAAYLQARKHFFWPALVPLISSVVVMIAYRVYAVAMPAVATTETITPVAEAVLAWGTTIGVLAMAGALIIPARRAGLRLHPGMRMPAGEGRKALALAGAGLGSVGAQQLALGMVLLLAMRSGGTGTLPIFQYAQAVYLLPYAVLVVPLITSVFPHLSEQRLVGDQQAYARTSVISLRSIVLIGTVGGATLFAAGPALEAFFHQIDRSGVIGVGAAVAALSLGLMPYAVTMQCTRILSASLRARDALIVGSVGWVTGAVLIVVVSMSIVSGSASNAATGFSLSLTIGMWVSAFVGLSRVGDLLAGAGQNRQLWRGVLIGGVVTLAAAVPGLLLGRWLIDQGTVQVLVVLIGILCGLTGALIAGLGMVLTDRQAARDVVQRLRRRRSRARAAKTEPTP